MGWAIGSRAYDTHQRHATPALSTPLWHRSIAFGAVCVCRIAKVKGATQQSVAVLGLHSVIWAESVFMSTTSKTRPTSAAAKKQNINNNEFNPPPHNGKAGRERDRGREREIESATRVVFTTTAVCCLHGVREKDPISSAHTLHFIANFTKHTWSAHLSYALSYKPTLPPDSVLHAKATHACFLRSRQCNATALAAAGEASDAVEHHPPCA